MLTVTRELGLPVFRLFRKITRETEKGLGQRVSVKKNRHAIHANNELDKAFMSDGNSACCRILLLETLKIQIGLFGQPVSWKQ